MLMAQADGPVRGRFDDRRPGIVEESWWRVKLEAAVTAMRYALSQSDIKIVVGSRPFLHNTRTMHTHAHASIYRACSECVRVCIVGACVCRMQ